jgi:hypothetical protein
VFLEPDSRASQFFNVRDHRADLIWLQHMTPARHLAFALGNGVLNLRILLSLPGDPEGAWFGSQSGGGDANAFTLGAMAVDAINVVQFFALGIGLGESPPVLVESGGSSGDLPGTGEGGGW